MNQGRIWCVVNPSVGLPLFLGSVALISFTVHFAVLNNTSWIKNYWSGVPMKQHASLEIKAAPVAELKTTPTAPVMVQVAEATVMTPAGVTLSADPVIVKLGKPPSLAPVPE